MKKNCRKAVSILSFSFQNNITEGERILTVVAETILTVAVSRTNYQSSFFLSLCTETFVLSLFVGRLWPSKKFRNVGVGCSCLSKMSIYGSLTVVFALKSDLNRLGLKTSKLFTSANVQYITLARVCRVLKVQKATERGKKRLG